MVMIFSQRKEIGISAQKEWTHAAIELNQPKCVSCLEAIYVQLDMPLKPLWADYLRSLGVCKGPAKGIQWGMLSAVDGRILWALQHISHVLIGLVTDAAMPADFPLNNPNG